MSCQGHSLLISQIVSCDNNIWSKFLTIKNSFMVRYSALSDTDLLLFNIFQSDQKSYQGLRKGLYTGQVNVSPPVINITCTFCCLFLECLYESQFNSFFCNCFKLSYFNWGKPLSQRSNMTGIKTLYLNLGPVHINFWDKHLQI